MRTVYPDYYPDFRCIAGACRHSCCVGWEIDIDPETLARYRALPGPMGQRLEDNISRDDPPHFLLGPDERCPFLNRDGLCDLILAGGEDLLCRICADHPRFYNLLPGREEQGLGLCCEAAAALILGREAPLRLVCTGEEESPLPPQEAALLALRDKALALACDRTLPLHTRMDRLLLLCGGCDPGHPALWADVFLELERLDPAWTALLEDLASRGAAIPLPRQADTPWEQLLTYVLYRHFLTAGEDGDPGSKAALAVLTVRLLQVLAALHPELPLTELARLWSAEIEYSTENLDCLYDELTI